MQTASRSYATLVWAKGRHQPVRLGIEFRVRLGSRTTLVSQGPAGGPAPGPDDGDASEVACPGCCLAFASLNILKLHRNSYRLANSACRAAASAMKRPRIVPLPGPGAAGGAAEDADGDDPGDADDLIDRMMMGDGDRGIAPEAAAADPSRYPRHGDGVSEQNNVCMRCVKCVQQVCK